MNNGKKEETNKKNFLYKVIPDWSNVKLAEF